MSRSLLLVSYFYPPGRDTGTLRPVTMAKYLRRLGHEVTVLTTSAYGELPDDQAAGIVRSADLQRWRGSGGGGLYRSDTYSSRPHPVSKLVVPEPLAVAWAPFARRAALRLRRERHFDCVITTSPPESVHTVGHALSRQGLPWVADLRDAWTFEPLRPPFPTGLQRRLDERLERRRLGAADVVVCVSEPAAADLRRRGIAEPLVIPNGWDPEEAPGPAETTGILDPVRVSLVYTGRFGTYGRDPRALVEGMRRLAGAEPDTAARLELVVAGPLTEEERRLLAGDVSPARIVLAGGLERERALSLQTEADALLLLAHPTRSQLLNIKLFEYMASGRPILALAAGTEGGRIVRELGGETVAADDPAAIGAALARLVADPPPPLPPEALEPYTYPAPAARMAEAVEAAIERR